MVSAIALAGYFLIARVVLDLFPFSTYSMYSSVSDSSNGTAVRGCHLLAVGPDGRASDVSDYRSWDCPPWEDAAFKSIAELGCSIQHNVEDPIREHMKRNRGSDPAAVRVDLVRRVWVFGSNQSTAPTDHLIASCRAVLR